MPHRLPVAALPIVVVLLAAQSACAQGAASVAVTEQFTDLTDLTLEQMLDIEVSLVTRHAQRIGDAPASVHVITRRDIEQSGLTSIPELLRLVPGVHVQRLAAGRWAIGTRGQPGQFTNNLLVLMDGRSVYTPLFSGTYWDMQDLLLDDIERIEVIRGPGGARWGANAVNGVINVVTRKASATRGTYARTIVGSEESIFGFRYGAALDESIDFRVSGKLREQDSLRNGDGTSTGDGYRSGLLDFRIDGRNGDDESWLVRGGLMELSEDTLEQSVALTSPFRTIDLHGTRSYQGHILGRYELQADGDSSTHVQFYYDAFDRDWQPFVREKRHTWDVELQHRASPIGDHQLTFGVGYRVTTDDVIGSAFVDGTDLSVTNDLASAFVLDEWRLCSSLRFNLGVKVEHNDFTGIELQPEARMAWDVGERWLLWASASRAVRTPSRANDAGIIDVSATGGGPGGTAVVRQLRPNPALESEILTAYELGLRGRATEEVLGDVNVFVHDYEDVVAYTAGTPFLDPTPTPHVTVPLTASNAYSFRNYGVESLLTWRPASGWQLVGGYSWIGQDVRNTGGADAPPFGFGYEPKHQALARVSFAPRPGLELNAQAFYHDATRRIDVDSFVRLDIGLTWYPNPSTGLSVFGQNLLDDRHPETSGDVFTVAGEVERSFHVSLSHRL